jgi:hypothetical protein
MFRCAGAKYLDCGKWCDLVMLQESVILMYTASNVIASLYDGVDLDLPWYIDIDFVRTFHQQSLMEIFTVELNVLEYIE